MALLGLLEPCLSANAQGSGSSPYSAYGLGDLSGAVQVSQALMGGTGLAITEPYGVVLGNPASYAALERPVFQVGASLRATRSDFSGGSASRNDANFEGFTIGVPFGKGKWGLALGLSPYSDVDYTALSTAPTEGGDVQYKYTGTGGLSRAFFGLGRTLYRQRPDTLGNLGGHLLLGADFAYCFGSIEETRDAIYPSNEGFNNVRSFSALVLRAPAPSFSLLWQGDLTRKQAKDQDNWRYSIGLSGDLPTAYKARYSNLVNTYVSNSGIETVRDSVQSTTGSRGTLTAPFSFGLGVGVQNARWAFTAEVHQQDWSGTKVSVPGYALPAPMRSSTVIAAGVRFTPADEGSLVRRTTYRAGIRHSNGPIEVRGTALDAEAVSLGVSVPLNAVRTNSFLNIGADFGQRGSTAEGLLQERHATLWIGFTFSPWRGERWFTPSKIQ